MSRIDPGLFWICGTVWEKISCNGKEMTDMETEHRTDERRKEQREREREAES